MTLAARSASTRLLLCAEALITNSGSTREWYATDAIAPVLLSDPDGISWRPPTSPLRAVALPSLDVEGADDVGANGAFAESLEGVGVFDSLRTELWVVVDGPVDGAWAVALVER